MPGEQFEMQLRGPPGIGGWDVGMVDGMERKWPAVAVRRQGSKSDSQRAWAAVSGQCAVLSALSPRGTPEDCKDGPPLSRSLLTSNCRLKVAPVLQLLHLFHSRQCRAEKMQQRRGGGQNAVEVGYCEIGPCSSPCSILYTLASSFRYQLHHQKETSHPIAPSATIHPSSTSTIRIHSSVPGDSTPPTRLEASYFFFVRAGAESSQHRKETTKK
ncbi:hypothetical protein LIA77_03426 [Sarocladium implicatum]|nr:hypothetical protein LIA77_03426 [Sarocladium implicatum]